MTVPYLVYCDDFACPRLRDTTPGYQEAVSSSFIIYILDYSLLSDGDTITFPDGSVLTATMLTANRDLGQFQIGGDSGGDSGTNNAQRNEIITTVNYFTNYRATANTGTTTECSLTCVSDIVGSIGNGIVSIVTSNPNPLTSSGSSTGGVDSFLECYIPRHQNYIDTPIPVGDVYDSMGVLNTQRYRFLTIPLAIKKVTSVLISVYGVPEPIETTVQVRARVSCIQNSLDTGWLPWEIIPYSPNMGPSFLVTKNLPITKIQIEIYGKSSGFSVYEVEI